jgi:hypothetical protein
MPTKFLTTVTVLPPRPDVSRTMSTRPRLVEGWPRFDLFSKELSAFTGEQFCNDFCLVSSVRAVFDQVAGGAFLNSTQNLVPWPGSD